MNLLKLKSASSNFSHQKMLNSAFWNFFLFLSLYLKKKNQDGRELDGPSHTSSSVLKPIILTKSALQPYKKQPIYWAIAIYYYVLPGCSAFV
jgi:hypothetical protein